MLKVELLKLVIVAGAKRYAAMGSHPAALNAPTSGSSARRATSSVAEPSPGAIQSHWRKECGHWKAK